MKSFEDLDKTTQLYGDHSYLVIGLTDGKENMSYQYNSSDLNRRINNLPDNWTLALMVPDQTSVYEAKRMGFPASNIQVWDVSSKGLNDVDGVLKKVTDNYLNNRAKGIRGTKNLFSLDTSRLSVNVVRKTLQELNVDQYEMLNVYQDSPIKECVEKMTKEKYRIGSGYYQLTKPEKIQPAKNICLWSKKDGKVYTGNHARDLLKLPPYEVKVSPAQHVDFEIFAQSTSVNRRLVKGTKLLLMK